MADVTISLSPRSGSARHPPGFHIQREASADINMHIVLQGSVRYRYATGSRSAKAGAMVALPIGLCFQQHDGSLAQGVHLAVIHAQAQGLPSWPQDIQVLRKPRHGPEILAMAHALARASDAWKAGDSQAQLEAQGLGQALIMTWFRHQPREGLGDQHWVAPLLALLQEQFADPYLDVSSLARRAQLSRAHFTRRFTAAVGISPARYLERLRLRHAQHLLAHGDAVGNTALACGYKDAFHFSRAFKRWKGVAPSQWRAIEQMRRQDC